MSKITYFFETPVPSYFRKHGWFDNENTFKFVTWAFSRCQTQSHKIQMNGKEIELEAYEFIAGRLTSPDECFLTQKEFRGQLILMEKEGFLEKKPNKITNRYTVYRWITKRFDKTDNQQNKKNENQKGPTERPTKGPTENYEKGQPNNTPHMHQDEVLEIEGPTENYEKGQPKGQPKGHKVREYKAYKKTTTTLTPSSSSPPVVVVVSSSEEIKTAAKSFKKCLDMLALAERKRRIGREYEVITWGNDWVLSLAFFESIIKKWGPQYVQNQINYMVKFQVDFDRGKSKNEVKKPEAFLVKACKENYANVEPKEKQ